MALQKKDVENKDMATKPVEQKQVAVKYIGPHDKRQLSTGQLFEKDKPVMVDSALADRLVRNQPTNFKIAT